MAELVDSGAKHQQDEAQELPTKIPYQSCELENGYERAVELIDEHWEQVVPLYHISREDAGRHLRITNVVESPFAALRLRTDAAKRFEKVANATAVAWNMLLAAERKFRRISSSELLPAWPPNSSITTAYRSEATNTQAAAT